jgi:KDO2-lipid IV(A) lauroyltransferase
MRLIIKLLVAWALRLSFEDAVKWGRRLGWGLGSLLRYRRAEVLQTIHLCFPEKSAAECRAVADGGYANLGQNIMEFLRFEGLTREWVAQHVQIDQIEIVREVLARGKGAIMLTAHLGSFQLPGMLAGFFGISITSITKALKPAALDEFWRRVNQRFGFKTVDRRGSFRVCLAALKANEMLGFMFDQNMKRSEGIFVDFFGRPACTTPGLALLSAVSGSPVIPVFTWRSPDGNHHIDVLPALPPPPDREPETIRQATQAYTAVVEAAVRRHPDQWIWIHRRWRTQPLPPADGT